MDNPVTVNAEIIKTLDPDLTENLSDDTINALISDAQLISISDGFPKFVTDIDGDELPVPKVFFLKRLTLLKNIMLTQANLTGLIVLRGVKLTCAYITCMETVA